MSQYKKVTCQCHYRNETYLSKSWWFVQDGTCSFFDSSLFCLSLGTGMTLPTGVTTYLLECLDVDSTVDCNTGGSDNLNSCPSPEIFRDDYSGETSGSLSFLSCRK